jgi:hypothetical protein
MIDLTKIYDNIKTYISIIIKYILESKHSLKTKIFNFANKAINQPKIYGSILLIFTLIILYIINIAYTNSRETQKTFISSNNFWNNLFKQKIIPHERHGIKDDDYSNNTNNNTIYDNNYKTLFNVIIIITSTIIFYFLLFRTHSEYGSTNNKIKNINNIEDIKKNILTPFIGLSKIIGYILLFSIIPILISILIYKSYSASNSNFGNNIIVSIINFLIVIGFLSIIYNLFNKNIDNCTTNDSIMCNIIRFIFFLPCLLNIFINSIKDEIKTTTPTILIILCIELVLICLLFLVPYLSKKISESDKHDLLKGKGPLYLNNRTILQDFDNISDYKKTTQNNLVLYNYKLLNDDDREEEHRYNTQFSILKTPDYTDNPLKSNYSISLDIYLNPQDSNVSDAYNRDAVIFDFCKRPIIMYNNLSRELIFKMINKKGNLEIIHKTKNFIYQKWNSIVINLHNNKVDIFINKILVDSINNIPIYFKDGNNNIINDIIVGENNGIHGSIKNIYYYNTIRNQNNLEFLFNRLKPQQDLIKLDDIKLPISKIIE